MIVSCPNCSTNFKVPEAALGRSMKCARCGHVWKAARAAASPPPAPAAAKPVKAASPARPAPAPFDEEIPLESPPSRTRRAEPEPSFDGMAGANDLAMAEIDALGFTGEGNDPFKEDDEEDPFAKMSELMRARQPESMPDVFAPSKPKRPLPRRKGAFILWVVLFILVSAAAALGLYFFQDRLIDRWPALSRYYERVGARRDEVGAGLSFRNYSSERLVQDNNEVLIVRGVIANGTDQKREIPLLRLALYNGRALLQDKVIAPPQPSLDARATVGFKVTLEQPDANATRFEVTFTTPRTK